MAHAYIAHVWQYPPLPRERQYLHFSVPYYFKALSFGLESNRRPSALQSSALPTKLILTQTQIYQTCAQNKKYQGGYALESETGLTLKLPRRIVADTGKTPNHYTDYMIGR